VDDRVLAMLVRRRYLTSEEADDYSAKGKRIKHEAITLFLADCAANDPMK
jgi:hypothetical protein